jgi:hypothetical protein
VDRDAQSAKFWLNPVRLAKNLGFSAVELRRIQRLLETHEAALLEKWNERCGAPAASRPAAARRLSEISLSNSGLPDDNRQALLTPARSTQYTTATTATTD